MPIPYELLYKYKNRIFVETGTYQGESSKRAITAGFIKTISLELDKNLYENAIKKLRLEDKIRVVHGDSAKILYDCIKWINEPVTFWLDAHYSGPGTSYSNAYCPIIEELNQIKMHHIKSHTILIDDRRLFGTHDRRQGIPFPDITEDIIIDKLYQINRNYNIKFEHGHTNDDIIAASVDN